MEVVAAAVGVEGAEEALLLDRFPKPAKAREGAFFLDQEGRDDLARGVVHGGDEVEVAAQIHQPAVGRAVLEQEHPRQGPARPPLAVRPAPPGLLHKTRLLQADLGPGIAEPEAVVAHQVLVEVLGREVPIARAVLLQDPFDLVKRRAAPRGPPQAPVHKTRRPLGLVAVAKPAKMTLRHPQDLRRLQTAQRAAAIAAQCFCYAHNPYLRIHRYPRFLGTLQETGHIACYTFRTYLVLLTINDALLAAIRQNWHTALGPRQPYIRMGIQAKRERVWGRVRLRLQRSYMCSTATKFVGGFAGLLLFSASPADALICASQAEQSALDARVLQTEFMVAALTCGQQDHYNVFAIKFNDALTTRGQTLRHLFERSYGSAATLRLDRFITRLANEASYRSLLQGTTYCTTAALLFGHAMLYEPRELESLTSNLGSNGQHGIGTCAAAADIAPLNFNLSTKSR